ncbi:MAG: protein kinase [Acidobacteria bacterium]|nr:protein kinase [Acidobacteriota bacterium]
MTLALVPGQLIGPYEILAPLGAGGMGEIYRARDPRLSREVAIKVLPSSFAADADRLARFEQEARAAGQLSHPNLITVFDAGVAAGAPFLVLELLDGRTLRQLLDEGPLPPRKAAGLAAQAARGLAAAHAHGILHRDLKPENLFVTRDGRLKVLDFGLAKRTPVSETGDDESTVAALTEEGTLLGTLAYMSPEQARRQPLDHRSDLFALGVVLYEMCRGRRPFRGATEADVLAAILREEPPALDAEGSGDAAPAPPGLARIVERLLAKDPEERFQQAADLAFALDSLIGGSGSGPAKAPSRARSKALVGVGACAALLAAAAGGAFLAKLVVPDRASTLPEFRRTTFRNGRISGARFAPGGREIVFSAAWEGAPDALFAAIEGSPESRSLGGGPAVLAGVAPSGELALLLRPQGRLGAEGTLARRPFAGEAVREIAEGIQAAAFRPDGTFAVVRTAANDVSQLESPPGTVLHQAPAPRGLSNVAASPEGPALAFVEHDAQRGDLQGYVAEWTPEHGVRRLTPSFWSVTGVAFARDGREVLFSGAASEATSQGIWSVPLGGGPVRAVVTSPDSLVLHDVADDGRLLVAREISRIGMVVKGPDGATPRDLSWLDGSWIRDLSEDGSQVLFDEEGDGGGRKSGVYLRPLSGAPAVRLGDGTAVALSPDGRFVLARQRFLDPPRFVVYPTGAGETREIDLPGVSLRERGRFLRDGTAVVVSGNEPGKGLRCWEIPLDGTKGRPVSPEGAGCRITSPDGTTLAPPKGDARWTLVKRPDGEDPRKLPTLLEGDRPLRFSSDGRSVFLVSGAAPGTLTRIELASGNRTVLATLPELPAAGLMVTTPPVLSGDGAAWGFTYLRLLSDLYVVSFPAATR